MIKYQLNSVVKKPKGTTVKLGPIETPLSVELQYRKLLNKLLSGIAAEVRRSVLPAVAADREQDRREKAMAKTFDAPNDSWFAQLKAYTQQLIEANRPLVEDIFELEAKKHDETFMAQAQQKLGIDLKAVIQQSDIEQEIQSVTDQNVSLITNMSNEAIAKIQQQVYQNSIGGGSVKDLQKKLIETFNMSGRRAKIIARDQTSKFNGQLNKIRQQQAGVEKYEWSTSHDERVRDLHRHLNGKIYKWTEKTGAEDGLPPGQPILCRCVAIGLVEWTAEEVTSVPAEFEPVATPVPATTGKKPMSQAQIEALAKAHAAVKAKGAAFKAQKEAEAQAKKVQKANELAAKAAQKEAEAKAKKEAAQKAKEAKAAKAKLEKLIIQQNKEIEAAAKKAEEAAKKAVPKTPVEIKKAEWEKKYPPYAGMPTWQKFDPVKAMQPTPAELAAQKIATAKAEWEKKYPPKPGMPAYQKFDPTKVGLPSQYAKPAIPAATPSKAKPVQELVTPATGEPVPSWPPSITPTEFVAVKSYKGSGYTSINENLRKGGKPTAKDLSIDSAIAKTKPMEKGMKLFRGFHSSELSGAARSNPDALIGKEIKDLGFISTSYNVQVSKGFSKNYSGGGVLLRIAPKPGLKALPIDNVGINASEKELLLARGTAMKINAVGEHEGLIVLDVEIM